MGAAAAGAVWYINDEAVLARAFTAEYVPIAMGPSSMASSDGGNL